MVFINRKYHAERDIEILRRKLRQIEELKEYIDDPRWGQIREIFKSFIAEQTQTMLDLCDKPSKNELEILATKKVVEWLCFILKTLDNEIGKADNLRKEIKHKEDAELTGKAFEPVI